jgi:hypothetical protein
VLTEIISNLDQWPLAKIEQLKTQVETKLKNSIFNNMFEKSYAIKVAVYDTIGYCLN